MLERSKTARVRTATLFAQLIRMKTLPVDTYCEGLEQVLEQADDLTIDIPKIWEYIAEIVGKFFLIPLIKISSTRTFGDDKYVLSNFQFLITPVCWAVSIIVLQ